MGKHTNSNKGTNKAAKKPEPAKPDHIKRPVNSWIIYRKEMNTKIKLQLEIEGANSRIATTVLSKEVSRLWGGETDEVKAHYKKLAVDAKKEHALKYPNYKYKPNNKGPRKKVGRSTDIETTTAELSGNIVPAYFTPFTAESNQLKTPPDSYSRSPESNSSFITISPLRYADEVVKEDPNITIDFNHCNCNPIATIGNTNSNITNRVLFPDFSKQLNLDDVFYGGQMPAGKWNGSNSWEGSRPDQSIMQFGGFGYPIITSFKQNLPPNISMANLDRSANPYPSPQDDILIQNLSLGTDNNLTWFHGGVVGNGETLETGSISTLKNSMIDNTKEIVGGNINLGEENKRKVNHNFSSDFEEITRLYCSY